MTLEKEEAGERKGRGRKTSLSESFLFSAWGRSQFEWVYGGRDEKVEKVAVSSWA